MNCILKKKYNCNSIFVYLFGLLWDMDAIGIFKSAREALWPVLTSSAFLERGVLTPEEFVKAGDQLVHSCRTWSWETGEDSKIKSYLPRDKQYLHIRRVPSYRRINTMQGSVGNEVVVKGDESAGGDWYSTAIVEQKTTIGVGDGVMVDISDLVGDGVSSASDSALETDPTSSRGTSSGEAATATAESTTTVTASATTATASAADEYLDMEDSALELDSDTALAPTAGSAGQDGIRYTRRYDVSITYDKYWQTPRIWLFGYDESGNPLPPASIFEDVIQDYAEKTVTIEAHPHLSTPHASIHPCQHAAAMLRIIEALTECGKVPDVEHYMFIFLKFMQSVMPTIEYDYTFDVQVRSK